MVTTLPEQAPPPTGPPPAGSTTAVPDGKPAKQSVIGPMILRRLLIMIPTLLGVVTITFILTRALGGNPAKQIAGQAADPATIAAIEAEYGFDKPLIVQYWNYITGLFRGDLGTSTVTNEPVLNDLVARFPATLEMIVLAIAVALLIGIPLGAWAARTKRKAVGGAISAITFFTLAVPDFWLALMAIYVFFFVLGWLPAPTGQVGLSATGPENITGAALVDSVITGDWVAFSDAFLHAVLPIGVLGILLSAPIARLMRGAMMVALESDFIRFGTSIGLSRLMLWRYAVRGSIPTVITFTGTLFVLLCGGAILIETVFSWGGVGQYAALAIQRNDYDATAGFVLVSGIIAMLGFLVIDLIQMKVDPRIRVTGRTRPLRTLFTWRAARSESKLPVTVPVSIDRAGEPITAGPVDEERDEEARVDPDPVRPKRSMADRFAPVTELGSVLWEIVRDLRPQRIPAAIWRTVRSGNIPLLAGGAIIALMVLAAFIVPTFWKFDVLAPDVLNPLAEPSAEHPFGTDNSGFDVFIRVIYAARTDLWIAFAGVTISAVLGIFLGMLVGYSRKRWVDDVAMRIVDMVQVFPVLIVAVAMVAFSGNSLTNVIWALVFINAPIFMRLARGEVLTVREHRYIEAAGAMGNSRIRTLVKHVLPNIMSQGIVQMGIQLGYAILTVAGLAFLGVGVQAPTAEWGSMILSGKDNIVTGQWWTVTFPGLAILVAVAGFNLLADGVAKARDIHR
jgi:peptide/nickel transport system permease protein